MVAALDNKLLAQLGSLNKDELRELRAKANFLLDPTGKAADESAPTGLGDKATDDQRLVEGELAAVLKIKVFPTRIVEKYFRPATKVFLRFIREEFAPKNKTEEVRVIRILLRCCVSDLVRRQVPVGPKTILGQMARIADVVGYAFPSYKEAGLLHVIVKKKETAAV
jgi:hypothetical protein